MNEKKVALDPDNNRVLKLRENFEALRKSGQALQGKGLSVHDLISFYSNSREEIFSDTCCHLNHKGNQLLAAEMTRIIREEAGKIYCRRRKNENNRSVSSSLKKSQ